MHSNKFACEIPFVVSLGIHIFERCFLLFFFFFLFVQTNKLQNVKYTLPKKQDKNATE